MGFIGFPIGSPSGPPFEDPGVVEGEWRDLPPDPEPRYKRRYTTDDSEAIKAAEEDLKRRQAEAQALEEEARLEREGLKAGQKLRKLKTQQDTETTIRDTEKADREYERWKSQVAYDKRRRVGSEIDTVMDRAEKLLVGRNAKKALVESRDLYLPSAEAARTAYFGADSAKDLRATTMLSGKSTMKNLTSLGQPTTPNVGLGLVSPPSNRMNTYDLSGLKAAGMSKGTSKLEQTVLSSPMRPGPFDLSGLKAAGMPTGMSRLEQTVFSNLEENQGSNTRPTLISELATQGFPKGQTSSALSNLIRRGVIRQENNIQEEPIITINEEPVRRSPETALAVRRA